MCIAEMKKIKPCQFQYFEEKIFREITVSFVFLLVVFTQNILMGTFYDRLIFNRNLKTT